MRIGGVRNYVRDGNGERNCLLMTCGSSNADLLNGNMLATVSDIISGGHAGHLFP